jgi:ERF superfamily
MPSTDTPTTIDGEPRQVATHPDSAATRGPTGETGEGNGSGGSSGTVTIDGPAGATTPHDSTPGSEPTIWSGHNVYQRIAWVITQLPAIPKDQEYDAGNTHYSYRGIESIQRTAANLLAGAGVVYAPRARVLERDADPPNTKPGWQDTHAEYEWIVRGTMGDQFLPAPVTLGIGRDNADKGANKGASQGLKYLLIALLQIADGKDDPDQHGDYNAQMSPEEATARAEREANPHVDDETRLDLVARVKALPDDAKATLVEAWTRQDPEGQPFLPTSDDGKPVFGKLRRNDVPAATALVLAAEKAATAAGTPPGPADAPAESGQSVADRAAAMAAQHTKPAAPEAASDAPSAPEADAGTDSAPPTAAAPTGADPVPEGTPVADANGEPLPDLAAEDTNTLAGRVRALSGQVPSAFVNEVVPAVQKLHHARVDAEIKGVPGQTVGEDEHIDHRRMRVSLVRLMVERQRRQSNGS